MIIVSNTTGDNTVSFIPREGFANKIVITDEVTGESFEEIVSIIKEGYLSVCSISTQLIDQRRYSFKVYGNEVFSEYRDRVTEDEAVTEINNCILEFTETFSNNEVLYNDILFCNTQDKADYSISNGELNDDSAPTDTAPQFIILD